MQEKRFFIPDKAKDIYEIEIKSCFSLIGDFDKGKIYDDISSPNHDLYYIEHDLMSDSEKEIYAELITADENPLTSI